MATFFSAPPLWGARKQKHRRRLRKKRSNQREERGEAVVSLRSRGQTTRRERRSRRGARLGFPDPNKYIYIYLYVIYILYMSARAHYDPYISFADMSGNYIIDIIKLTGLLRSREIILIKNLKIKNQAPAP